MVVYQPLTVDVVGETLTYNGWSGEYSYGEQESYMDGKYIPLDAAEKFLEYAQAGVPIVVVGDYTEFHAAGVGESDEELQNLFGEIEALGMLYAASDETGVTAALEEAQIAPDVRKDASSRIVSWKQSFTAEDEGVDADFYWLFNYQKGEDTDYVEGETVTQTIHLQGSGSLYKVDLWSGEVSLAENYTADDSGISLEVSLGAYDIAMYVLIAGDETAADGNTTDALTESETIALTDFTLSVESWTSGYGYTDGKLSTADVIVKEALSDVAITDLASQTWDTLTFTDSEGNEIDGSTVSGVGSYSASFTISDFQKVSLNVGDYFDTVKVYVNGTQVPVNMIDASDVDITAYVQAGENALVIETASDLQNVCLANATENSTSDSVQSYGLYGTDGAVVVSVYN